MDLDPPDGVLPTRKKKTKESENKTKKKTRGNFSCMQLVW